MIFKEKSQGLELDISKCGQKQQDSLLSGVAVVASVEWSWGQEGMRRTNTVTLGPIHVKPRIVLFFLPQFVNFCFPVS